MRHDAHDQDNKPTGESNENMNSEHIPETVTDRETMTLIPWEDIWTSLKIAKHGGNGEMVAVFYDTLFKEAVFDDNGAWAWYANKRN